MLKGWKTYIVVAGAALTALGGYLTGQISLVEFVGSMFAAAGVGSLRAGVATEVKKLK